MSASDILRMFDEVGFESARILISVLWQSSVLFGGVAVLSWMLRGRGASARRALWVCGVLAVPVLPLLVCLGALAGAPRAPVRIMPVYSHSQVSTVAAGEGRPGAPLTMRTVSTAQVSEARYLPYPWALAFGVYLAGAGWCLLSIARARMCIRRLIRNGSPTTDPLVLEAFRGAARGLGLRGNCRILESDEAGASAVVVGVFRPVVLLGRDFAEKLSDADLAAVAYHELAHVKRRDPLVLGLVSLVRAVFFFHPLIWFATRQVVLMAERAADDEVLARTARPVEYAGMLVRLAREFSAPLFSRRLAAGLVLSESVFLQRAKAILSKDRYGIKKLSLAGLVPTVIAMAAWLALAAVVPVEEGRLEGKDVLTYDVNIPDAWKSQIAVGKLTIEGPPFYTIPWFLGLEAVVSASLPVENLTSQALYVPMSFRTEPRAFWPGASNKEAGASYTLEPGEKRIVKAFVPLASVKRSNRFKLRMSAPYSGAYTASTTGSPDILIVDPLPLTEPTLPDGNITLSNRLAEGLAVEEVALDHSEAKGNILTISLRNDSDRSRQVVTRVGVNDLKRTCEGFSRRFPSSFHEYVTTVPAGGTATVHAACTVPDKSRAPVLAFVVFEPRYEGFSTLGTYDHRKRDYTPVAWGHVDMRARLRNDGSEMAALVN